jgi:hypothetical protein
VALINHLRLLVERPARVLEFARGHYQLLLHSLQAQVQPEAFHEVAVVERLGDVAVRAEFGALRAVRHRVAARAHHDGNILADGIAFDCAADVKAVNARQHYVEEDEIREFGLENLEGVFTVACPDNIKTLFLQKFRQQIEGSGVVFYNQDSIAHFVRPFAILTDFSINDAIGAQRRRPRAIISLDAVVIALSTYFIDKISGGSLGERNYSGNSIEKFVFPDTLSNHERHDHNHLGPGRRGEKPRADR